MQNNKIKAAFLDRDGVINEEVNYLHKVKDFKYTVDAIKGMKKLTDLGYFIVIVTNQAGIARGIFSTEDYFKLTDWYINDLKNSNVDILGVYFCPHHKDGIVKELAYNCNCRKPKPGMLLNAANEFDIDLSQSIIIGDKISDVEAGVSAGLKKVFLVNTGHNIDATSWNGPVYDSIYNVAKTLT